MLFFEFFPLFVALVGALTCVWLVIVDRRARRDPASEDPTRRIVPPREPGPEDEERGSPRPSMR